MEEEREAKGKGGGGGRQDVKWEEFKEEDRRGKKRGRNVMLYRCWEKVWDV